MCPDTSAAGRGSLFGGKTDAAASAEALTALEQDLTQATAALNQLREESANVVAERDELQASTGNMAQELDASVQDLQAQNTDLVSKCEALAAELVRCLPLPALM